MAHVNKVIRSINNEDVSLCVDIFRRPDNTFGFEEYRREIEDNRGWFPIGGHSSYVFDSDIAALRAARGEGKRGLAKPYDRINRPTSFGAFERDQSHYVPRVRRRYAVNRFTILRLW